MTPEQLTAIMAVAKILEALGSWPLGAILAAAVGGPWAIMVFVSRSQDKRIEAMKDLFQSAGAEHSRRFDEVVASQEKRFAAVTRMYENNIELVRGFERMAQEYRETVVLNTATMQEVRDISMSNLFCPMVRKAAAPRDIEEGTK